VDELEAEDDESAEALVPVLTSPEFIFLLRSLIVDCEKDEVQNEKTIEKAKMAVKIDLVFFMGTPPLFYKNVKFSFIYLIILYIYGKVPEIFEKY